MSLFAGQPNAGQLRALLAKDRVEATLCLHLDFGKNPLRLCARAIPFTDIRGERWTGGGGLLVGLPEVSASDDELAPYRDYILGIPERLVSSANWRGAVMDEVRDTANYKGRAYRLSLQIFDQRAPVGNPITIDQGQMSRMEVEFAPDISGLRLQCEAGAVRMNVPTGQLLTYADQKSLYPTDEGLEFVAENYRQVVWTKF